MPRMPQKAPLTRVDLCGWRAYWLENSPPQGQNNKKEEEKRGYMNGDLSCWRYDWQIQGDGILTMVLWNEDMISLDQFSEWRMVTEDTPEIIIPLPERESRMRCPICNSIDEIWTGEVTNTYHLIMIMDRSGQPVHIHGPFQEPKVLQDMILKLLAHVGWDIKFVDVPIGEPPLAKVYKGERSNTRRIVMDEQSEAKGGDASEETGINLDDPTLNLGTLQRESDWPRVQSFNRTVDIGRASQENEPDMDP